MHVVVGSLSGVDYREFNRLREGLVSNLPPANGTVLDSAASKLRHRLMSSAMFAEVAVETTEDSDRLLVVWLRFRPGTPLKQVSSYLEAVWVAELRLSGLDAFHFRDEDGRVELESITGDHASGYFLTLHLTATEGSAEDFVTRPPEVTEVPPPKRRWFRRGPADSSGGETRHR